ncbi:hypothetical protein ABPG77_000822 [Micractinium sp. CCAP 211/92]
MEVFLGSLALGAAGAAAEGLYRRFKRRRIGTTAHGDGREAKQRLSRELKHLQPFGWDKYLEDQPLGPEMDSVLHHIQEAVQEAEEEVGGQQADAEETAAEERAHSGTGGGGAARRHRGRAKRWDSDEEC